MKRILQTSIITALLLIASAPLLAADCDMRYSLDSWSLLYKEAKGHGVITCSNGQTASVKIQARGIGLTVGKSKVPDGRGEFTGVSDIKEIYGTYVQAEAHAGVVKTGEASVLTKGPVSLVEAGSGEGVGLGVDISRMKIEKQ